MRKMDKKKVENMEKVIIYGFLYIITFSYVCLGVEYVWLSRLVKGAEVQHVRSNPDRSLSGYLDLGEHVVVLDDGSRIGVHPSFIDTGVGTGTVQSFHRGKYTGLVYKARVVKGDEVSVWRFFDPTVIACLVIAFTIFIPIWREGAIAKIIVFLVLMRLAARLLNGI